MRGTGGAFPPAMTKHRLVLVSVLGLALAGATATSAQANTRKKYRTDQSFGLGLMFGAPTGLSGKYYMDSPIAIAFGVGSSHYGHGDHGGHNHNHGYNNNGTHLHADVLWHPIVLVSNPTFQLPLHVGVGAQIRNHDHGEQHSHLGARGVGGLTMDFNDMPLDAFFELAYSLDFTGNDSHSYIAGSLGGRYYF